ncbi:hypothetical protein EDD85DRAFT_794181 [Armillaria nabsnona]|nr:hypothetical protein EDD85DRAFT_794181 [Armillaria nabsnona]
MAEPMDPQELTKVQAQDTYNASAAAIDELLDDFPNPTWNSTRLDTWLIDVVSHWLTCEDNWSCARVVSKEWYKLEYRLLERVPELPMDLVTFACTEFNELVEQAVQVKCSKAMVLPSQSHQDATTTGSWAVTPTPVPLPPKPTMPLPLMEKTPVPHEQQSTVPVTPQRAASHLAANSVANPSSSNVQASDSTCVNIPKPSMPRRTGLLLCTINWLSNSRLGHRSMLRDLRHQLELLLELWSLTVATVRSNIIQGPNPSLLREGSVPVPSSSCKPLFLPGTDDEEDRVDKDLAETGHVNEEVAGSDDEDDRIAVEVDDGKGVASDEDSSPIPTKARRLQKPKTEFVFDDVTGDFDPYPTIFLPRRSTFKTHNATLRHSSHPQKKDSKEDAGPSTQKEVQGKDKDSSTCKRPRNDSEGAPVVEKPVAKRFKSKETNVDVDEVVRAMPAIRKRRPGPSKPPPVTLGTSGGGFGEKIPSSAKEIKNGIKSIGVLKVEKDFSNFVQVDGRYWNKDVAPFVGERQPCEVNGEAALNPLTHYHPKGYGSLNTFESALNPIEVNNAAIAVITQQFLAALNVQVHSESIHVQMSRLHEDHGKDDVPDDVAEGVAGPSKKRKHK